jgi:hypothetical protein
MQTLNWTSEDDHPSLVSHARDIWWILDFPNAFVSPGVNSRGELVPSHGATRRRLGDKEPCSYDTSSLTILYPIAQSGCFTLFIYFTGKAEKYLYGKLWDDDCMYSGQINVEMLLQWAS